ncbi:MAG: methionyl aminopeptidase [Chlamydiota bacterium]
MGRNDPCWCGSGKKWKKCHFPQANADTIFSKQAKKYYDKYRIILKDEEQVEGIRQASRLAAWILDETCKRAQPGVTTQELNDFAYKLHKEANAIPAPLNYGVPPFPKSICTSLNDVICHGIPSQTVLQDGDILNIDVTPILNGYYGDCNRMVVVGGKTSKERQLVVDVARESLDRSMEILKPGIPLSLIGETIESYATSQGCSVVYQFVGHGVGVEFHEPPEIQHCRNRSNLTLTPGMTFTIEPMINAGIPEGVVDPHDHWTVRTIDGSPSAQWEHTILITDDGHEVLTLQP